jgi:hypothetical protein
MIDPQKFPFGNPPFDSLKLKPGKKSKNKSQTEKKGEGIQGRKIGFIGGLVGQVN